MYSIRKRDASDWAGCLICLAFVAFTAYRVPRASLGLIPLLLPDLLRALAFLIRGQKTATLPGLVPKIASYLGSYTAVASFDLCSYFRPQWVTSNAGPLATLGLLLILLTTVLMAWAVWALRYSFSIEPQARGLVTAGPYSVSRHPIYVLNFLQMFGVWLRHRTVAVAAIMLAAAAFQGVRMHYEERVLGKAFAEYADYRKRVDIFGLRAALRILKDLAAPARASAMVHTTRG